MFTTLIYISLPLNAETWKCRNCSSQKGRILLPSTMQTSRSKAQVILLTLPHSNRCWVLWKVVIRRLALYRIHLIDQDEPHMKSTDLSTHLLRNLRLQYDNVLMIT